MKTRPILNYRSSRPNPASFDPPSPGFLTNASALFALIVGVGAITTGAVNAMTSPRNTNWDPLESLCPVLLGGTLLAFEYHAYFRRSVIASILVGLLFLLFDTVLLLAMWGEFERFPRDPLNSLPPLTPWVTIVIVAAGHFTWAYRLQQYKIRHDPALRG